MSKKSKKKVDRRVFKKEGEELQQYLHFRKRGSVVKNKKGKGAYKREKRIGVMKHDEMAKLRSV